MQPMWIFALLSAAAFLDIKNGNVDKGLVCIENDINFCKRVVCQTRSLMTKLIVSEKKYSLL